MSLRRAIVLSRATLPAFAAEGVVYGSFAAYVPQIKAGLAAGDAAFGAALLVSAAGAMGAMLLAPAFEQRVGRGAMALAAVGMALAAVLPVASGTLLMFTVALGLLGASSGLLDIVMNARVSVIEGRHSVSIMNLNHAGFSAAYAASALLSGATREAGIGPLPVFLSIAVVLILSAPLMIQRDATGGSTPPPATPTTLPLRPVLLGGLIVFAAFLSENATEGWSALHIERTLGGGAAQGALGPAMLGLTMMAGRFAGQLAAARLSEALVIRAGAGLAAIGAVCAALAPAPVYAYAGFAVLGLGVSVIVPMALALVGRRVPEDRRALAISRTAVIGYMGFFTGPPLMGLVAEALSLRASFLMVAVILAAILALVPALHRVTRA